MFATKRANTLFVLWFFGLIALVGVGVQLAMLSQALVVCPILLPLTYMWVSSLFMSGADQGWPCSPRMFLGMLVGALAIIWVFIGIGTGWH